MLPDKRAYRFRREDHDDDRHDHGNRHDGKMIGHPHRRHHRVEGKHDVDDRDLQNNAHQAGCRNCLAGRLLRFTFHRVVNFGRCLRHQEKAAGEQQEVAPGDLVLAEIEDGLRERHDPCGGGQKKQTGHNRCAEAEPPPELLLMGGQPRSEDRQENEIVDAENDLEDRQRCEACPVFWLQEKIEHEE